MRKVYICHQYYEPTHFKALYDCAQNYNYQVQDLIVLNPASALKHRQELIEQKGEKLADEWYQNNFISIGKLWLLKDEIVVIGLAPYDRLLAQYQDMLSQNYSILLTSWMDWHSGKVRYQYPDNKAGYLETLMYDVKGVACVSRRTEQEITHLNSETQVVNHAIRIDEYIKKSDFKRRGKYIFLGRFIEIKNLQVIIEYLKEHPEKNIEIDLAGTGILKGMLEEYASQDKRLHLIGYLSKDEIKKQLHKYDYLILPSHEETFGIVLLEALACGVPCIVSNALGPIEIISNEKTGIIFKLEDIKGFEKAMNHSIELDDNQYEIMSKNASFEGKKYDVNEIIKNWVALFERVCNKG